MKNTGTKIQSQQQQQQIAEGKIAADDGGFNTQDMLRDRIKAIEKKFSEIKTNFHKSLSSIS